MFNELIYLNCILNLFGLSIDTNNTLYARRRKGRKVYITDNLNYIFNLIELDLNIWDSGFKTGGEFITYLESSPYYNSTFASHRSVLPLEIREIITSRPTINNSKSFSKDYVRSLYPENNSLDLYLQDNAKREELNKMLHIKRLSSILPEVCYGDLHRFKNFIKRNKVKINWDSDLKEMYIKYNFLFSHDLIKGPLLKAKNALNNIRQYQKDQLEFGTEGCVNKYFSDVVGDWLENFEEIN